MSIVCACVLQANKPLMEKRRRARINQSLAVLKSLILDSARLENTKHSKLEKADILELTVRHLQRNRSLGPGALTKYRAGFAECTREVSRFLEVEAVTTAPDEAPSLKTRLLRHLQSCAADLEAEDTHGSSAIKSELDTSEREEVSSVPSRPQSSAAGDENNNADNKMASSCSTASSSGESPLLSVVQVVPSRLPDGQLVFLLPSHYVQLAAWARATSVSTSALPALTSPPSPASMLQPPHSPRCRPSIGTEELMMEDTDEQEGPLDCSRRSPDSSVSPPQAMDLEQHVAAVDEGEPGGPVWRPWDTLS
ncbi:hypothetical protein B566_EDAN001004 [Ephemera danica]|nr:hypothetical protein B566_EDAN001004 [Ephemera danica]